MIAKLKIFYRSVLFQIILVGLVSFAEPGIWNALNNLGAGGQQKPYLVNAANSLTYGIMSIGCALAGGLCNKIGLKWTLVLGVIFYTPYASSLYCNNRFGNEWYVLVGAALCGIGASMFWASEAAIGVGYPSESQRGRMVAIWLGIRNLAPLIGGSISLAVNVKGTQAGKVSYNTYLALIGLQCLGLPFALLLSPTEKVRRPDGTPIPHLKGKQTSFKQELREIFNTLKLPHMVLLIPIFISGIWGTTYLSNYLTHYFSVRSRSLAALLTAVANIIGDVFIGFLTDTKRLGNQAQRARFTWLFFAVLTTSLWIWQTITQIHFTQNPKAVDWQGSTSRFNNAFAVFILWKFAYESQTVFLYWLVGTYPAKDGTMPRIVGVLRTFESIGSCLSYAVGATHWPNLNQCILSFALWMVCLVPTTLAVLRVPTHLIEHTQHSSSSNSDQKEEPDQTENSSIEMYNNKDQEVEEIDGKIKV